MTTTLPATPLYHELTVLPLSQQGACDLSPTTDPFPLVASDHVRALFDLLLGPLSGVTGPPPPPSCDIAGPLAGTVPSA